MVTGAHAEESSWWPAIAAAICLALAIVLSIAAAQREPFPGDVPVVMIVQSPDAPILDAAAWALSWLGRFPPMAAIGAAVAAFFWRRGETANAVVVVAATLLYPLNALLKVLVGRQRPPDGAANILERATGLGFPSGHAFGAMLLFGTIAALAASRIGRPWRRAAVVAGCVGVALLIGWSRVRLGAHWPSDVLGGWLWGAGVGLLLVTLSPGRSRLRGLDPARSVATPPASDPERSTSPATR